MVAGLIVAGLLLLLLILFGLPLSLDFGFKEEAAFKIRYAGIPVFDSRKSEKRKKKNRKKKPEKAEKPKKENFFSKTKREKGFAEAIRLTAKLLRLILMHSARLIRKIKLRKLCLKITVATDSAAKTAIEYGAVCASVYPALSALFALTDTKVKSVDISADFDSTAPQLEAEFSVRANLFLISGVAVRAARDFLKLTKEDVSSDERK